jgi:hypothetical protein
MRSARCLISSGCSATRGHEPLVRGVSQQYLKSETHGFRDVHWHWYRTLNPIGHEFKFITSVSVDNRSAWQSALLHMSLIARPPISTMQSASFSLLALALLSAACVCAVSADAYHDATKQDQAASCPAASSQCEAVAALKVERLLGEVTNLRREIQELKVTTAAEARRGTIVGGASCAKAILSKTYTRGEGTACSHVNRDPTCPAGCKSIILSEGDDRWNFMCVAGLE